MTYRLLTRNPSNNFCFQYWYNRFILYNNTIWHGCSYRCNRCQYSRNR
ncbi:hypothetical protein B9T33_00950 [Acinetobacter sp. ANC 5054]|nr:hypothetical protein B9T33_00950 [Acinetobacter sp. ANC 5054]